MTDTNELLALLLRETVHLFQDARAQLRADDQRAWEALGKPEGTHDTTNVQRLCAEVERLRADLRRALRLLAEAWSEGAGDASWSRETFALMELHKEKP